MRPVLIGLSGKAEHGKTATAAYMKSYMSRYGTCAVFEISTYIYEHCVALGLLPAGLVRAEMTKEQIKVLVDEGSRMRNEVDPNYWTNIVIKKMLESGVDVAICPNLRFPQEAQAIRDNGGTVMRLVRLNEDGSPFVSVTRDPNHETETALDRWPADFYLFNMTGHPALLERLVRTLFCYIVWPEIGRKK